MEEFHLKVKIGEKMSANFSEIKVGRDYLQEI